MKADDEEASSVEQFDCFKFHVERDFSGTVFISPNDLTIIGDHERHLSISVANEILNLGFYRF